MKLRRPFAAAIGIVLSVLAPAMAVEPYLQFVHGLRDRDYHDYAIMYLEQLEQRSDVPADVKEVIPYEKAVTLLDGVRSVRSPEAQGRQLDQAREFLEQFLKASPDHANSAQASTELAKVYEGKGRVDALQSRSPGNAGQKAQFQQKARSHFAEARQVYQAAQARFKSEYDKFDKFIPPSDKARHKAREQAYVNWINAEFNLAKLIYEEAQTYDKGSDENRKMLTAASMAFDQIHTRHRTLVAGLHARMWEGKCFEEQDDITKALGIYDELLSHGKSGNEKPAPALKSLQDRVLWYRLICLNHEKRKDFDVAFKEATEWVKQNRNLHSTHIGLGIQWELVRSEDALGRKEGITDADRTSKLKHALTTSRAINRFPGEYKDASNTMIQRLMIALDREPGDPKDFPTAYGTARNLIEDVKNRNRAVDGASAADRERLIADRQPVLKEAARILGLALTLATPKDEIKDVNRARYLLAYVYYSLRDYSYDSAVLGEFVARKYYEKMPDVALDAAHLAQAAYIQAYGREPEAQRAAEVPRIIAICNFITDHWPDSDKAQEARMNLGALFNGMRQPAEAAKWYLQIPESSPQYLEAQMAAGNAYWSTYLFESIRPEAERPSREQLDELLKQARGILSAAITRYEAQLPKEIDQIEPARLGRLTSAKLTYAEILNGSGDFKGALAFLTEGPLAILTAVVAPGGDEKQRPPKPSFKSRENASYGHQLALRAYVGTQDLDKARAEMNDLEKIEGAGGGGAALTRIYLDLGRELEKEVNRLQSARDPRLAEVLKSFERFLDDMSSRKEGQDYNSLMWVAETYRALGEGLEQGDAAKSTAYFSKGVAALQWILDAESRQPGYVPAGNLSGVQLRKVTCLRRQKSFEEAQKLVREILKQRTKALDAQVEAARLYQDWAARGGPDDRKKWAVAIDGDQNSKKKKPEDKVVWGWFGIAQRLETNLSQSLQTNSEYVKQFLEARYNVGLCRLKDALSQSTREKREELLELAKRDVLVTASISPDWGDGYEKFNALYREIQNELVASGLQKEEVVDLEKRLRKSPADLAAGAKSAKAKKSKSASRKTAAAKAAAPEPAKSSGGGLWTWLMLGLVVAGGGGAAAYFMLMKKKVKVALEERSEPVAPAGPPKRKPQVKSRS
ncbi:MAG: hypothetical protein EXS05_21955 [Planctomycetaceae bacterium]|nr:hypothetical protein [Planctomycetaceae bacterium]